MAKKKTKKKVVNPQASPEVKKAPVGRPSFFKSSTTDEDKFNIALRLAKSGKTNEEICYVLGCTRQTLYRWEKESDEFSYALKNWKADADEEMERSLFEKGRGYSHKETKTFYDKDSGIVVEHDVIKHYAPDTAAAFIWLKNRRPQDWKDRHEVDLKGLVDMDDEKLAALVAEILAKKKK